MEPFLAVVEELHLVSNGITDLHFRETADQNEAIPGFSTLRVLSLMDNNIHEWREIWRLRCLSHLEKIMLANNRISLIFYEEPKNGENLPFSNLQALSVSGTLIDKWDSLDVLQKYPALSWLRAQDLPLYEKFGLSPKQARLHIIARLPNIQTLNGSEIRRRERSDEEQSYVCMVADEIAERYKTSNLAELLPEDLKLASERKQEELVSRAKQLADENKDSVHAKLLSEHPRFFELLGKHGDIIVGNVSQKSSSDTLGSNVVSLTIRSMAASSCMMDPVQKKLPLTMTVGQLKQLAARSFKMEDVSLVRLSYRESKVSFLNVLFLVVLSYTVILVLQNAYPDSLDNDMKPLSFFGISNEGEILVEEVSWLHWENYIQWGIIYLKTWFMLLQVEPEDSKR